MLDSDYERLRTRSAEHLLSALKGQGRWASFHRVGASLPAPLRQISTLVFRTLTASDIPSSVSLPAGVVLMHRAIGVVISREATIEAPGVIFHGVTLGSSFVGKQGAPSIGPFVTIGTGATVLGPVSVGPFSTIGAGVTLTKSVPPLAVVLDSQGSTAQQDPALIERRFGLNQSEVDFVVTCWNERQTSVDNAT